MAQKNAKSLKKSVRMQSPSIRKPEVQHVAWSALELEEVNPQFHRQILSGESVMLSRILLKKGFVVPFHQHHNEQVSFVVDGALKFTFEDKEVVLKNGEVLVIPPNVRHSVEAITDTLDFDIFSPPRIDWINKSDAYLRVAAKQTRGPRVVG
jgi:quercetin dioxygenase-like cupin family protein